MKKKILMIQIGASRQGGAIGGINSFIYNTFKNINHESLTMDFLASKYLPLINYKEELESYGSELYEFNIDTSTLKGKISFCRKLKAFLKENEYDVIHINSGILLFNYLTARTCKKVSNAKIVVHSHNNGGRTTGKEIFSAPLKSALAKNTDAFLACSRSAAEYMFPQKQAGEAAIINNGIYSDKFAFNPEMREEVRKEMNLTGKFVIGNVGRISEQKNHTFILDVFAQLLREREDAELMLVGPGKLFDDMVRKAGELGISDKVMFLGRRNDVDRLYQAMDVFFLPSIYEGLGIVNIEAQSAGLHCVVSDVVPREVNIGSRVDFISLKEDKSVWIDKLLKPYERKSGAVEITAAGFNIENSARQLEKIYLS